MRVLTRFKKPKATRILGGALGLLLVLTLVLMPAAPALAVPQPPHQFEGTVTIGTELAPEGTIVSAKIDGIKYESDTVDAEGRYGYDKEDMFMVPADDSGTPDKEGGVPGETVEFYITNEALGLDEVKANETAEFEIWGVTELNLTVADTIVISPDTVTITADETQAYTAAAYDASGNEVADVTVATTFTIAAGAGGDFVDDVYTPEVEGEWTVTGTYSGLTDTATLTVTPGAAASIVISPDTVTITAGQTQAYTAVSLDVSGNEVADVTAATTFTIAAGAGGSWVDNTYTSEKAGTWTVTGTYGELTDTANLTVEPFIITASAGANGSIDPVGAVPVDYSASQVFTIIPDTGYEILDVLVDGTSVGAVESHTFEAVTADGTIHATFILQTFTITVTQGDNGTITPGTTVVDYGEDQTFTITADEGYSIADVLVDGESVMYLYPQVGGFLPVQLLYTFEDVAAIHTISATFAEIPPTTFIITASADANGTIAPVGAVEVIEGDDQEFTITPSTGYEIEGVLVNGVSALADVTIVEGVGTYTFENVVADQTISATFASVGPISFTTTLLEGWNLLSTPILLDADSDTLGLIFGTDVGNTEVAYSWDAQNERWVLLTNGYKLLPLYGIYVKVSSGASATAEFIPSGERSELPSRELQRGLNLIGPAPALAEGVFPDTPLGLALISIEEAEGGLRGYTIVVSPEHNQTAWSYALGGEIKDLVPFKGYWVVMENGPDTLVGFSTTP